MGAGTSVAVQGGVNVLTSSDFVAYDRWQYLHLVCERNISLVVGGASFVAAPPTGW